MTGHEDDETDATAGSDATSTGTGSGRGGDLGAPSTDSDPPSEPQESNSAVSGGGVVDESEDGHA